MIHKNNINKNQMMINTAKDTFKRINQFWDIKNNNNNDLNYSFKNYNSFEKKEKLENNKLGGTSYSSLSSAISTCKCEDSNIKDINMFHDPYYFDYEKNNDKENHSENQNNSNNKNKNLKDNNLFMTPYRKGKNIDTKSNINSSSSQNSFNMFINKKRKNNNSIDKEKEKEEKDIDYFPNLNSKETKRLIRGIDIFFK